MCATTAARELGLVGHGVLAPGAVADLVVLDANFSVVQTYVGGQLVYAAKHLCLAYPSKPPEDVMALSARRRPSPPRRLPTAASPAPAASTSSAPTSGKYVEREEKHFCGRREAGRHAVHL